MARAILLKPIQTDVETIRLKMVCACIFYCFSHVYLFLLRKCVCDNISTHPLTLSLVHIAGSGVDTLRGGRRSAPRTGPAAADTRHLRVLRTHPLTTHRTNCLPTYVHTTAAAAAAFCVPHTSCWCATRDGAIWRAATAILVVVVTTSSVDPYRYFWAANEYFQTFE